MLKDKFLQYLEFEKRYSGNTIIAYKTDLLQFYDFLATEYATSDILEVDHQIVRHWIFSLIEIGISNSSVNRKITTLKSYFRYLIQQDIVIENPMIKIIAPKNSKRLPVFIEKSKMEELLDHIKFPDSFEGERDKLIIDVFYMTGIRLSELLDLKLIDINFKDAIMKVVGKRNKERAIPLSRDLLTSIKGFVSQHSVKSYLFTSDNGRRLGSKVVYNIVNKYLGMVSSIEKKSPHILRHTFATHMLNNGADINSIKEILGHVSLSATQVYTHNTIDRLKNIYKQAHPRA